MRARAILLMVGAGLGMGASGSAADSALPRAQIGGAVHARIAGSGAAHVIVALREPGPARSWTARVRAIGAARAAVIDALGPSSGFRPTARWASVAAIPGVVTAGGLARLSAAPGVARVDLDLPGHGGDAESLPFVRGDIAHAAGSRGRGVGVAVLDTGVDTGHPDLAEAVVAEACFVYPSGCPNGADEQFGPGSGVDEHGHGTNVAGIVASRGGIAPVGVAPEASIVSVRVMDARNSFETTAQIVSALDWVALSRPDVRVVNMSLGTFARFAGNCDNANAATMALASAVGGLRSRGVVVFASTLNDGSPSSMTAPACVSGVVAVGAVYDGSLGPTSFGSVCSDPVTAADRVPCFSNGGTEVDVLAPGVEISSTATGRGVSVFTGTSQASPHAAGAAALLIERSPDLTPDAVERTLESTGVTITDHRNGLARPRLDIAAALGLVRPEPAVPGLAVGRRSLVFGSVAIGRSRRAEVVVRNVGNGPLVVTASASRSFTVVAGRRLRLPAAGASGRVVLTFAPSAVRTYRGTLRLTSNDPDRMRVVVTLSGTGRPRTSGPRPSP